MFAAKSKQNLLQKQAKLIAKINWAELTVTSLNIGAYPQYSFTHKIFASNQNVCAHLKISAHIKIFASNQNICAHLEISAHTQNIRLHVKYSPTSKYSLTSKIFAPYLKYLCCIAPAQLFFIERGCLSNNEIGGQEKERPARIDRMQVRGGYAQSPFTPLLHVIRGRAWVHYSCPPPSIVHKQASFQ